MPVIYAESGQRAFKKEKTQLTHEGPQYAAIWTQKKPLQRGTDALGGHSTSPLRPASHPNWTTAETSINEAAQRQQHPSTANSLY